MSKDNESGRLTSADDLWQSIFLDRATQKIKPRIYSYVIDDNAWQFGETGYRFFSNSSNKHAVLGNCSEFIRYAGEFHLRPKFGWNRLDDEWELVFDNASGTYSPNADLLATSTGTEREKKRAAPLPLEGQVKKSMANHHSCEERASNITSKPVEQPKFVSAAEMAAKARTNIQMMPEISDEELLEMAIKFEKEHPQ
ncbi:unnamed protein product [Rotaria sp. Silwood1]|nr:unnamed protein product [Rotaria sp. Silwood1]